MFATLAGKALVPVGLAVTGFMVVCCLVLYSVIREDLHRAEIVHATNLADTILKSTRYAMHKSDRETLATIIQNVGEQNGVDHVRIFNKKGIVTFSAKTDEINRQVDKNTEGCVVCHKGAVPVTNLGTMQQSRTFRNPDGLDVMAITAPIYNSPGCSSAACHFHLPDQKVLGTLDVGLLRVESERSLALLRIQMIIFTLMSLILTIGGVTALLRRNVFIPIHKLRNYVEFYAKQDVILEPPPHLPHDLDVIAESYYNAKMIAAGKKQNS
ncbi:MAG: cytochrome C [Desulfuromonadaceae bacterium]|nr:cytochrome C [Desulfuromonadaceae bacterium]MDD5107267.1 cytochrome C [Desulfuromonadaceae bacterium]